MKDRKTYLKSFLIVVLFSFLSSCGGREEGEPAPSQGAEEDRDTLSGSAVKGPIENGVVHIFMLNSNGAFDEAKPIAEGRTDSEGNFESKIPEEAEGPLLIEIKGPYQNEATGEREEGTLRYVTHRKKGEGIRDIVATPLSTIATEVARSQMARNKPPEDAINLSYSAVAHQFSIPDVDIRKTVPLDLTKPQEEINQIQPDDPETKLGLVIIGIVEQARKMTVSPQNLTFAIARDAKDENFDGLGSEGQKVVTKTKDQTEIEIKDQTTPQNLGQAIKDFLDQNPRNASGIRVETVALFLSDLSLQIHDSPFLRAQEEREAIQAAISAVEKDPRLSKRPNLLLSRFERPFPKGSVVEPKVQYDMSRPIRIALEEDSYVFFSHVGSVVKDSEGSIGIQISRFAQMEDVFAVIYGKESKTVKFEFLMGWWPVIKGAQGNILNDRFTINQDPMYEPPLLVWATGVGNLLVKNTKTVLGAKLAKKVFSRELFLPDALAAEDAPIDISSAKSKVCKVCSSILGSSITQAEKTGPQDAFRQQDMDPLSHCLQEAHDQRILAPDNEVLNNTLFSVLVGQLGGLPGNPWNSGIISDYLHKLNELISGNCQDAPPPQTTEGPTPPPEAPPTAGSQPPCEKEKVFIGIQGWNNNVLFRLYPDDAHEIAEYLLVPRKNRFILGIPSADDIKKAIPTIVKKFSKNRCGIALYLDIGSHGLPFGDEQFFIENYDEKEQRIIIKPETDIKMFQLGPEKLDRSDPEVVKRIISGKGGYIVLQSNGEFGSVLFYPDLAILLENTAGVVEGTQMPPLDIFCNIATCYAGAAKIPFEHFLRRPRWLLFVSANYNEVMTGTPPQKSLVGRFLTFIGGLLLQQNTKTEPGWGYVLALKICLKKGLDRNRNNIVDLDEIDAEWPCIQSEAKSRCVIFTSCTSALPSRRY